MERFFCTPLDKKPIKPIIIVLKAISDKNYLSRTYFGKMWGG